MRELTLQSEAEMEAFGRALAETLEPGDVLALAGDLGAGKTTLTKAIAAGLGVTEPVTSPTFTIVTEHRSGRIPLFHFDVYRLEDGQEFLDLGGDEYLDAGGVSIIEWADRIAEILPDETKFIKLEYGQKEGERICQCFF